MYSTRPMSRTLGRKAFKGRGTLSNPPGRFERQDIEEVHDGWYEEDQPDTIATTIEPDRARGIITRNDSPDIPFEQSINPYRGCEHGCVYCYARPSHAFMGLSSGIDSRRSCSTRRMRAGCWRRSSRSPVMFVSRSR